MSWDNFVSQALLCVLITSGTGSVMFIIWLLGRRCFEKKSAEMSYYMLRWIVIMFLLPYTYVAMMQVHRTTYIRQGDSAYKMLFILDKNTLFYKVLLGWCIAMALFRIFEWLVEKLIKAYIVYSSFDDGESYMQSELERIKEVLGIENEVILLRNDDVRIKSPMVTGIRKYTIVVPYVEYEPDAIKVIFYHELSHIKKKDTLFRSLMMFATIVHGFNPFMHFLKKQIIAWSEKDCDITAVDASDRALKTTQIVGFDGDTFENIDNWSEEMVIPANEVVEIVYINDGIMTTTQGSIDWDVEAGVRCVTAEFYMKEGAEVQIACTASPSTCTYWFGLMRSSSECLVVEGSGSGSHTFTVPSNGYYRIMVENRSTQDMNVTGVYRF